MTLTKTTIPPECNEVNRQLVHTLDFVCGAIMEVITLSEPLTMAEIYHKLSSGSLRPESISIYKGIVTVIFNSIEEQYG